MEDDAGIREGAKRAIDGEWRVHYGGYWIKAYDAPADSLLAKKVLIEALTRRLFNHVEHGINIPGRRLDEARLAFERESDPARKRIKGAMLAGALFNRATDVLTKAVDLQALGIDVGPDNPLMRQCGDHLQESLSLCRLVLHRSGDEGIDELWGEPLKAFAFPIEDFYRSRYIKIAATLRDIDRIREVMIDAFGTMRAFEGLAPAIVAFAAAAKLKCQTLQTDPTIFEAWSDFVTAGERLLAFQPLGSQRPSIDERLKLSQGLQLIVAGKELVTHVTRARVPMPKSTREYLERVEHYRAAWLPRPLGRDGVEPLGSLIVGDAPHDDQTLRAL
ncbi:MAG TPA: hypothetical protein VH853_05070 [Polyangia bacterium]|jgi:hypothetical protein|nr:hypothetical protein [Polyangia bacterium]